LEELQEVNEKSGPGGTFFDDEFCILLPFLPLFPALPYSLFSYLFLPAPELPAPSRAL
jgi:hypothetical protein